MRLHIANVSVFSSILCCSKAKRWLQIEGMRESGKKLFLPCVQIDTCHYIIMHSFFLFEIKKIPMKITLEGHDYVCMYICVQGGGL